MCIVEFTLVTSSSLFLVATGSYRKFKTKQLGYRRIQTGDEPRTDAAPSVPSECLTDNAVNASTSNCVIVGAGSCGWGPINFYVTLSGEGVDQV